MTKTVFHQQRIVSGSRLSGTNPWSKDNATPGGLPRSYLSIYPSTLTLRNRSSSFISRSDRSCASSQVR
jgi:hypothetical protein